MAVVDLDQGVVVEGVADGLPEIRVLRGPLLRVHLDAERRHAREVRHDDPRHLRDLVEVVAREALDDISLTSNYSVALINLFADDLIDNYVNVDLHRSDLAIAYES